MTEKDIDRIESEYLNDCENTLEMEKVFELAKRGLKITGNLDIKESERCR